MTKHECLRAICLSAWLRSGTLGLLAAVVWAGSVGAAEPSIFRSGDELVIRIERLDSLRQRHATLTGLVRLTLSSGERTFTVDLADRAVPEALTIDLSGFGDCTAASLEAKNAAGEIVHTARVAPVPMVVIPSISPTGATRFAAVERGTQLKGDAPQIALPDVHELRIATLRPAGRVLAATDVTYPVIADVDLPALASANAVIVSRQSFAPDDAARRSLYFSYRKALFDPAAAKLTGYRKMLVEVPLDRRWLNGTGDDTVTLPSDGFAIHTTEELERFGRRWNAPQGYNALGETSTGLFQGGQTADVDEQGRIYVSNVPDGAGLVRFNPHTASWEQPPVNFHEECRRFLPSGDAWRRSWDADLAQIVCTRGRVYLVFDRHYRTVTPNGKYETCSGVISVPQDLWHDGEAFRRDVRLHAGCWPQAQHPLYPDDVEPGTTRRAGSPIATTHGIAFGSWRLDLDAQGNTQRLTVVKSLTDAAAADGAAIPPTQALTVHGLPQQKFINVGAAGRQFLKFQYGQFEISRAALGLVLPGVTDEPPAGPDGRYRTTYPGAPPGNLTIRFDIAGKIKAESSRYARLAGSLSGVSQGPNYAVIAIPGQADQAVGVCEYSYYFSQLDFSRRAGDRKVYRSYLPLLGGDRPTDLPINVGLGPYNMAWVEHDDALWLYTTGYTGLGRLKYAERGRPLAAFTQELFHGRLAPRPIDGRARDSVKDYLHVVPTLDGRLINIGRGRPGRGGGAYSAGLELFDPRAVGPSETAVVMNRCYGLYTPVSRIVYSAAGGAPRQQFFVAGGNIRPEYVADIDDPALRPQNQDPKIFAYECESQGKLRDLYGFSLPALPGGRDGSSNIAFSPCRRFLVILQAGGAVHTFDVAGGRFLDGVMLQDVDGRPVHVLSFARPTATVFTSPDGRIFFGATSDDAQAKSVSYYEITVSTDGRLTVQPHLTIAGNDAAGVRDFDGIVRCFLPDLNRGDGSYDLVLGGSYENGGQPTVKVIDDFIPPQE